MARDGSTTPGPGTPGVDSSDDSESRDWSPPNPESSSKTKDWEGGGRGGGRAILLVEGEAVVTVAARDLLPPVPDATPGTKTKG